MPKRNRVYVGLLDASYSLEEQAAGRDPELSRALSGAITLDTLFRRKALDADLQEAAFVLERAVTEGRYHLDARGKSRAVALALVVRRYANRYAEKTPRSP